MGPKRRVRITVRGRLSERLATAFEGMTTVSRQGATDLLGEVVDQAHLYGLLTQIRDLGLELESVNPLFGESPPRPGPDHDQQPGLAATTRAETAPQTRNSEVTCHDTARRTSPF